MRNSLTFTIFTAAYNRPNTLRRAYESLEAQTFRDFEWLIIDDGSGSQVQEAVKSIQAEAQFPVRYIWQENQGKHAAHNHAVELAHGRYFAILDDDDTIMPNTLERMAFHWGAIPESEREQFVSVIGHCVDQNGKLFGKRFPAEYVDADFITMTLRNGFMDELWGSYRTDVLRDYPYPVAAGPGVWLGEGVTWTRMARKYKSRFVDEVWRTWYVGHYSQSSKIARKSANYRAIAPTTVLVHQQRLAEMIDLFPEKPYFIGRAAVHYTRFSLHAGYSLRKQWHDAGPAASKALWAATLPLGIAAWLIDQLRAIPRTIRARSLEPDSLRDSGHSSSNRK